MAGSGTAHMRSEDVLLRVEHLVVEFGSGRNTVRAVSDVSFDVAAGETLGLVGESGCGKSTTGRAVALVHHPDSGSVKFEGTELTALSRGELRRARTKIQMVFQDPISSLNPRRRVLDAVIEPLSVWGIGTKPERRAKARATLDAVGIDPDDAGGRRPIEMSGGQCQRVSIARALMLDPTVLVCDEPVSALDVSVQAQILNLLADLKRDPRAHHGVHRARPGRREERERPGGGHVPRQAVRGGAARGPLPRPRAPLHRGPPHLHPRARSRGGP